MTFEELCAVFNARRTGPRRAAALCSAHQDRSPSLSLTLKPDGKKLMHCHAGCDPRDVLAAKGLTWRDLEDGPPRSPEAARLAWREEQGRAALEREQGRELWRKTHVCRRLGLLARSLGERMAWLSEGDESLTALFHLAQDAHHRAAWELEGGKSLAGIWGADPFPIARPVPVTLPRAAFGCSPFDGPDAEHLEADRVRTEAQLWRFAHHGCSEPKTEE